MKSRPLRVLIASDGIPPFVMGGMQKHSRLVAEYLARQGVEVLLYHYVENVHVFMHRKTFRFERLSTKTTTNSQDIT